MRSLESPSGFTLLEMMIAMLILAVLTILTSTSIRSAIQTQGKFESQIEQDAQVREALRVMEKDLGLAFHHRDTYITMLNQISQDANKTTGSAPGLTPTPAPAMANAAPPANAPGPSATPKLKTVPKELTAFQGDEKSLYFTSLSNIRVHRDEQVSDQAKIGYFLKTCKSVDSRGKTSSSNCLWRRISPVLDDQIDVADKNSTESVLLENVTDFKLKYYGPGHEEWLNAWKTSDSDASMKDNFPFAVEIYLKVQNKNNPKLKVIEMKSVASIHFPNNEVKKDPNASPSASASPSGPAAPGAPPGPGTGAPLSR